MFWNMTSNRNTAQKHLIKKLTDWRIGEDIDEPATLFEFCKACERNTICKINSSTFVVKENSDYEIILIGEI